MSSGVYLIISECSYVNTPVAVFDSYDVAIEYIINNDEAESGTSYGWWYIIEWDTSSGKRVKDFKKPRLVQ